MNLKIKKKYIHTLEFVWKLKFEKFNRYIKDLNLDEN